MSVVTMGYLPHASNIVMLGYGNGGGPPPQPPGFLHHTIPTLGYGDDATLASVTLMNYILSGEVPVPDVIPAPRGRAYWDKAGSYNPKEREVRRKALEKLRRIELGILPREKAKLVLKNLRDEPQSIEEQEEEEDAIFVFLMNG